jgi:hypothetical protein
MSSKKETITNSNQNPSSESVGKSYWLKWYVSVIGFLVAQVIFYYLITIYFQ